MTPADSPYPDSRPRTRKCVAWMAIRCALGLGPRMDMSPEARLRAALTQLESQAMEDCPICVHLNHWHGDKPIHKATHGAGGPDSSWSACYEHYRVIAAFEWLRLTRGVRRG